MIQRQETQQNRQIELLARPIRYAYIIGNEPSKKDIIKIIANCCESFGGSHNLIIPSNGELLEDWWLDFLISGDPDLILLCGKFNDINSIKSQISQSDIQPFKIKVWHGERARSTNYIEYSPIALDKVYKTKVAENIQLVGQKANIFIAPRKGKNIDLIDYFNYGIISAKYKRELNQFINFINCNKLIESKMNIGDTTEISSEYINHAEFEYFDNCYDKDILGPYVAVTGDENSLQDCCLLWNWRALASRQLFVQWISKNKLNDLYKDTIFHKSVLNLPIHAKLLTSVSLGKSNSFIINNLLPLNTEYAQLVPKFGFEYKHPSEYINSLPSAEYFCERNSISLYGEEPFVITRNIPHPYKYEDCLFKDLIVDICIRAKNKKDKSGVRISSQHSFKDVFNIDEDQDKIDIRRSRAGFTGLLPAVISTQSISIRLKTDWEIILNICKRRGLNISESPSGLHIRRAIQLAGSIEELANYYRNNVARKILDAFLTNHNTKINLKGRNREIYRRSFNVDDLRNTIINSIKKMSVYKKRKVVEEIDLLIKLWWKKGIIISGFELKCPECHFENWYPIELVGDTYVCWRCQLKNKRPVDSQIQYRLQESFYQAHFENMIVPILTLNFIKTHVAEESFLYSVPFSLDPSDPNSPDIDIIALVDGELVIAECKKPNKLDQNIFERYSKVAKQIKANRIVFSTITRQNTCETIDCRECAKLGDYSSDEIYTHGSNNQLEQWGTREKIVDFRHKMEQEGILVTTLCSNNLGVN